MDYRGIDICCPACRGDLRALGEDELQCIGCSRSYPVIVGIPDLRLWSDPYIGIEEDRAKGRTLAAACAGRSFADSVELYYSLTTVVPPFQAKAFTRALLSAVPRAAYSLDRWRAEGPDAAAASGAATGLPAGGARDVTGTCLLDVGCGTAPLLVAASAKFQRVVGVDIAFRWLVLARKRLEEAGIDPVVVCACAEALPFPAGAFTHVAFDSTIEHLRDQSVALGEANRVMRETGCLYLATPNRLSLGPDPHAGIWAGGWLPDGAIASWVRRKGGVPPRRSLLSRGALQRALARAGFERTRVFVPNVPAAQRAGFSASLRLVIDAYNGVVRTRIGRALLLRVGPLLHAVARKPASLTSLRNDS